MDDVLAGYRLFLRRPIEPEGHRYFEAQVERGLSLERLASIFLESDEFKRLAKPKVTAAEREGGYVTMDDVRAAYQLFLGRLPEEGAYSHWEGQVEAGITLRRLSSIFLECDEFRQLTSPDITVVELAGGYSVCVDSKDTDFAPGIIYNRDYEPHVRRAIAGRLREGQTFVDIGANVGCISFLAAKLVGPAGRVVAFEPNPNNLQRLYAGIVLNQFANIKVMPYAVSDARTVFSLAGGTSNTVVMEARGADTNSVYAQSVVPDEELAHLPAIDVIKIDIEGHEPNALRGCAGLIRKHDPILFTEFAPRCLAETMGYDPMAYLLQLFALYRRAEVLTQWGDSAEFDDPEKLMDYWRSRDRQLAADGTLPGGMLHFDIVASNR